MPQVSLLIQSSSQGAQTQPLFSASSCSVVVGSWPLVPIVCGYLNAGSVTSCPPKGAHLIDWLIDYPAPPPRCSFWLQITFMPTELDIICLYRCKNQRSWLEIKEDGFFVLLWCNFYKFPLSHDPYALPPTKTVVRDFSSWCLNDIKRMCSQNYSNILWNEDTEDILQFNIIYRVGKLVGWERVSGSRPAYAALGQQMGRVPRSARCGGLPYRVGPSSRLGQRAPHENTGKWRLSVFSWRARKSGQ